MVIYQIRNLKNDKRYIGCANSFRSRERQHRKELSNGVSTHRRLQEDWTKFGADRFAIEILEDLGKADPEEGRELEQYWMDHFNTLDPEYGYNKNRAGGAFQQQEQTTAMAVAYANGENVTEIGKRFGVSQQAVSMAARARNLPLRQGKRTPEQVKTIIEAIKSGKSWEEIQNTFKISEKALSWFVYSRGLNHIINKTIPLYHLSACGLSHTADRRGQRFGRLVVLDVVGVGKTGRTPEWLCQCDCGKSVTRMSLSENSSCGCLKKERLCASWAARKQAQKSLRAP